MNLFCRDTCLVLAAVCLGTAVRAQETTPTVIKSDSSEMVSTANETTFTFRKDVVVTGTNLKITCDQLVVVANRTGDPKATIGKQDKLRSLVATGHVHIVQNDREAACDKAEVLPGEDKAVLSGHLVVRSLDGTFVQTGERGTLLRGERRAIIEGEGANRPTIILPALQDLGYGKEPTKNSSADQNPPAAAPQK